MKESKHWGSDLCYNTFMEFGDFFEEEAPHSDLMNLVNVAISQVYPQAGHRISYKMPAWDLAESGKSFFYALPSDKHLGLYPHPPYIESHAEELKAENLRFSKGAVQIPYNYPEDRLFKLVQGMVRYNLKHKIKR